MNSSTEEEKGSSSSNEASFKFNPNSDRNARGSFSFSNNSPASSKSRQKFSNSSLNEKKQSGQSKAGSRFTYINDPPIEETNSQKSSRASEQALLHVPGRVKKKDNYQKAKTVVKEFEIPVIDVVDSEAKKDKYE